MAFMTIISKLWELIFFLIGTIIILGILAAIYCWIFNISYTRFIITFIVPFINIIISIGYIFSQIIQIPLIIFNALYVMFFKIVDIIYYGIVFINTITNFIYDASDNLF